MRQVCPAFRTLLSSQQAVQQSGVGAGNDTEDASIPSALGVLAPAATTSRTVWPGVTVADAGADRRRIRGLVERVAAKQVLSQLLVRDLRNEPVVPYEDDEVMLNYQTNAYHDTATIRELLGLRPYGNSRRGWRKWGSWGTGT